MDSVGGDVESGEKVDREPRMHIMADLSNEKFHALIRTLPLRYVLRRGIRKHCT